MSYQREDFVNWLLGQIEDVWVGVPSEIESSLEIDEPIPGFSAEELWEYLEKCIDLKIEIGSRNLTLSEAAKPPLLNEQEHKKLMGWVLQELQMKIPEIKAYAGEEGFNQISEEDYNIDVYAMFNNARHLLT